MQRFNLTFQGEVLPGTDPATARFHFSRLFQIQEPARIERFFSGDSIVLRRNLEQQAAATWYAKMRGLGLQAHLQGELDPQPTPAAPPAQTASAAQSAAKPAKTTPSTSGRWGPNPYTLKPYRSPAPAAGRALQAGKRARLGLAATLLAVCLMGILAVLDRLLPPPAAVPPLVAAASSDNGDLMLVTANLLLQHDRSGAQVDTLTAVELGLTADVRSVLWLSTNELLVQVDASAASSGNLYRCSLSERQCRAFSGDTGHWYADAAARVPSSDDIILANNNTGRLYRVDGAGNAIAEQAAALPALPILRIDDGLLFINSAAGPALGVFRYEASAFAEQLDELLLLPEAALAAELSSARDFARVGAFWWAILENPDSAQRGVFRFDAQWTALAPVLLPAPQGPSTLVAWGDRILLLEPGAHSLLRYAAEGVAGKTFESEQLNALDRQRNRSAQLRASVLASGGALCLLAGILAIGFSLWQYNKQRVLAADRGRHAPLLGPRTGQVQWLKPAQAEGRPKSLAAHVRGHIGTLGQQLIVVDHRGVYHTGNGIQIQRHPRFLRIEGVQLYIGSREKPAFDPINWRRVEALLAGSGRADNRTIVVTLLESHWLLTLGTATVLTLTAATAVLWLCA